MVIQIGKKHFLIDIMSIGLNLIGFLALMTSWADGLLAVVVALLIFLLDEVKHPNPVIMELKEGDDDDDLVSS